MCTVESKSLFPESVCAAEGPDPCELAQNPRYRKGPDVCFDNNENVRDNHTCLRAENIAGNSSISEASQLASVNSVWFSSAFCRDSKHCLIFNYFIYSFSLFFLYSLFLFHEFCMQLSLNCFYLFCFEWPFHSSSVIFVLLFCIPMAAALVW